LFVAPSVFEVDPNFIWAIFKTVEKPEEKVKFLAPVVLGSSPSIVILSAPLNSKILLFVIRVALAFTITLPDGLIRILL
jgi:hypothetical protein